MVNAALFEQFLRLDAEERREFVRAAQGALGDDTVPVDVRAVVEHRLAEMSPEPATEFITLAELRDEITARRAQHVA